MKPRHLLKELEQVAAALALTVRTQPFRTAIAPGGLCKLRGQSVVLLNSRTHEDDRALVLAEVLNTMDVTDVAMSEDAREFLAARHAKRPPPRGAAGRQDAGQQSAAGRQGSDGSKSPGNDTRHGPGLRKPRLVRGTY